MCLVYVLSMLLSALSWFFSTNRSRVGIVVLILTSSGCRCSFMVRVWVVLVLIIIGMVVMLVSLVCLN